MEDVTKQGWRYQVRSTVLTFVVSFLSVLLLSFGDFDVNAVKHGLETSGLIAGLRIFGKLLLIPVFNSLWEATKSTIAVVLAFLKKQ